MRSALFLIMLIVANANLLAQTKWSIRDSFSIYLQRKPEFSPGLDSRHSYITGTAINIFGVRAGADYKKLAFYGGFYGTAFQDERSNSYDYFYLSGQTEYRWYKSYKWLLLQTVQFGVGSADLKLIQQNGDYKYISNLIVPIETGVLSSYRVWKYVGVSAGVGARFSMVPGTFFSSSYYTFGVVFYPDEIMKTYDKLKK
jgi:hypothetical protein